MKKYLLLSSIAVCFAVSGAAQDKMKVGDKFEQSQVVFTLLSADDMTVSATWAANTPDDVVVIPSSVEHDGQTFTVAYVDFNNDIPVYQLSFSEGITDIKGINDTGSLRPKDFPTIRRLDLPGSMREIPSELFTYFTGLEEVTLAEGIESLGLSCFRNSHLHHLHIPASVNSIMRNLCCVDKLEEITVHPENPYYYSQENTLIDKEQESVILGNRDLFIPANVTTILGGAYCKYVNASMFREKDHPRDLIIPQNITRINLGAFGLDSIATLRIPNTTTLDFGWINFDAVREIIIEDGDTPFYYTPLMPSEGAFRFNNRYNGEVDLIYIGRNKKGVGNMFLWPEGQTVQKLVIGPKVTEFREPNEYVIKSIYSLCEEPESVDISFSDNFYLDGIPHNTYTETTLYVPAGMKERYMAAEGWKNFQNIQEVESMPAGISAPRAGSVDDGCYYNLQGQRQTASPTKGIYIIRQNNSSVKKVIVK